MVRQKQSIVTKWQIIGMNNAGLSCREIRRQLGRNYIVINRLVRKYQQTNDVKDRNRPGQARKTSPREDRALLRLVRRCPFSFSTILRDIWIPNRAISTRIVRNRLKPAGYRSRRPIKHRILTPVEKAARLSWCQVCHRWNLASWTKIHWSDERRFLLHMADGRPREWRKPYVACAASNIQETIPIGGGSVMVWACVSRDFKSDLVTFRGNLTGPRC